MNLSDYMEQELMSHKIRKGQGEDEGDSISSLRRYVEDLRLDDVDSTISDVLNDISTPSCVTSSRPSPTVMCSASSSDEQKPTLNLSQWSAFSYNSSPSKNLKLIRGGSIKPMAPSYSPNYEDSSMAYHNYYDNLREMHVKELDSKSGDPTKSFTWDMLWKSPELKKYVRPQPSNVYCSPEQNHYPFNSLNMQVIEKRNLAQYKSGNSQSYYKSALSLIAEEAFKEAKKHSAPRQLPLKKANVNIHARTSICKFWQRGSCTKTNCNFAHGAHELKSTIGIWKTTICYHWKQGNCRNGANCRHAHGEQERQPRMYPLGTRNRRENIHRPQQESQKEKFTSDISLYESYLKWYGIIKRRMTDPKGDNGRQ